jgi:hypothetical protein
MDKDCKKILEDVKVRYVTLKKKYLLPDWERLDEDFDISKAFIEDGEEFLLREIRRKMGEKISSYLPLFESFMNPSAAPLFIMNLRKSFDGKDIEKLRIVYKKIIKIHFKFLEADTIYSEEKEIDLIKEFFEMWQNEKKVVSEILQKVELHSEEDLSSKGSNYFG